MFYMASCRRGLFDTTAVDKFRFYTGPSAHTKALITGRDDAAKSRLIGYEDEVARADLLDDIPNRDVVIHVHGYRSDLTKFERVVNNFTIDILIAKGSDEQIVHIGFAWPGSWSGTLGFLGAEMRAAASGRELAMLVSFLQQGGARNILIEAHSLGCVVTMEALRVLPTIIHHSNLRNLRILLTAAALPKRSMISSLSVLAGLGYQLKNFTIAYSKDDPVLRYAYRSLPWNWFSPALGSVGIGQADTGYWVGLILLTDNHKAPYTLREAATSLTVADFCEAVKSHSGYRHDERYLLLILRSLL